MPAADVKSQMAQWGCGIFFLGVIVWLLLPAMDGCQPAKRTVCRNNLKQIEIALHNYRDAYDCFPPAYVADATGRPIHSWRVLILPYLDQALLYNQYRFEEPWNGPNNSKLADIPVPVYQCPTDVKARDGKDFWTSYVAVVGPHSCWPGTSVIRSADIKDGSSNTLHVAEIRDSGIHWMEPRDLYLGQMAPTINARGGQGISSGHTEGANVSLADGSVRFVGDKLSAEVVRQLIDRDDGGPASNVEW